jgi:hypothetical protein
MNNSAPLVSALPIDSETFAAMAQTMSQTAPNPPQQQRQPMVVSPVQQVFREIAPQPQPQPQMRSQPGTIAMDVTGMSEKQISALENASSADGIVKNGLFIPTEMLEATKADRVIQIKKTKRNRFIYKNYGLKAFDKATGKIKPSALKPADLVKEIIKKKDVKGGSQARTNYLERFKPEKLEAVYNALGDVQLKQETRDEIKKVLMVHLSRADSAFKKKLEATRDRAMKARERKADLRMTKLLTKQLKASQKETDLAEMQKAVATRLAKGKDKDAAME